MKLDATDLRYISSDAFRVLSAVEQGSKNHELVPTSLIAQISGARSGGVNKSLGELAKKKLVGKVQNAKYEGYRLTYGGYDFLACRTFAKRDTVYSVGNQIGTGKESDIYVVADDEGTQYVMKIHRLGRVSFRAIKSKRDYLRKGQSASWMYMSRLAAIKEFAFMKVLHDHGFPVPRPIDQSRHCLIMELIDAFPLRQIASVPSPGSLYSALMDLIVRLAKSGLIHGDFNEFNILIRDHRSEAEKDRDDETPEERQERIVAESGDFPVVVSEEEMTEERKLKGVLEPILIDFPQMVSTDHVDAEYYFNRDVQCIRTFFSRRFKYDSSLYPKFTSVMKDGTREFDLDVEVSASGFSKGDRKVLEEYMAETEGNATEESESEEEEHSDISDDEAESAYKKELDNQNPGEIIDERSQSGRMPLMSHLTLNDSRQEAVEDNKGELKGDQQRSDNESKGGRDVQDEDKQDSVDDEEEELDDLQHRRHKPSAPRRPPSQKDVSAIVSEKLAHQKKATERRHHGQKVASSNVLGKHKGSKMKSDSRRAIQDSAQF